MPLYALYKPFAIAPNEEPPIARIRALIGKGDTPEAAQADALVRYKPQDAEVPLIHDAALVSDPAENTNGLPEIRRCGTALEEFLRADGLWPEDKYLEESHPLKIEPDGSVNLR